MAMTTTYEPNKNGVQALLDLIYRVKFSRHTPLVVVLLSMVYTVYRSNHYLQTTFKLNTWVSLPTSTFLELIVFASAATVFLSLRSAYVAMLNNVDQDLANAGVYISLGVLVVASIAMLMIAAGDAWLLTNNDLAATVLMTLVQLVQAAMIGLFIIDAILDERKVLRDDYAKRRREQLQVALPECKYCGKEVAPNNIARHEATCRARS